MASIQASTGLISGIPIADTVDKLIAISARPRDLLLSRNEDLQAEQTAVTALTALLASVQYVTKNLAKEDLYAKRAAASSNPSALAVTVNGTPALGTYQFTPLRMAQSQQLLSSGVKSNTDALGGGTLTFRYGDTVQRSADLDQLGGGQGFVRGKIRITDRSGASAVIDLSSARTLDDVLQAINDTTDISVTAVAQGDHIRLMDQTGGTANLRVQEVGGTTAASLGLADINAPSDSADGHDLLQLYGGMELDVLNDGAGVSRNNVLPDIQYTLADGTTGTIDLSPILPDSSEVDQETTLDELLTRINAAAPNKLKAEIAPAGDRLMLTDLTAGGSTFQVSAINGSQALADLGLDGAAVGNTVSGNRILGGLKTVLLSSLGGGNGLGALGNIRLTDRSGAFADVNLSSAETLDDVIDGINAASVGITARVNRAGNGIELVDTTGATAHNLTVADTGGGTVITDRLKLTVDAAITSKNSGDLHLRVVARNTRLADLNGGTGVAQGKLTITDTTGARATLNVNSNMKTVGDVVDAINRLSLQVRAELNDTGDGILLEDLAHGSQTLAVTEGSSTTAKDLHLLKTATTVSRNSTPTQVVDGSITETITLTATESLDDLKQKINDLSAGLSAATFSDGSSKPWRLSLVGTQSGRAGSMVVDDAQLGLTITENVRAEDALLAMGDSRYPATNVLLSSATNKFQEALSGASLEIKSATGTAVTVTTTISDTDLVASVKTLVDNYNKFREQLQAYTKYDTEANTGAVLTGDSTALRLDMELPDLLSGAVTGAGSIHSLAEVGITLNDDGTLEFDETTLTDKYAADPDAVKQFFATKDTGLASRLDKLLEQLSGVDDSLLSTRLKTLSDMITENETRADALTARLDTERERLLLKFYAMDAAIAKMQNDLSAIGQIKYISPVSASSS